MLETIANLSAAEAFVYCLAIFILACLAFAIYEEVRYPEGRPPIDPEY